MLPHNVVATARSQGDFLGSEGSCAVLLHLHFDPSWTPELVVLLSEISANLIPILQLPLHTYPWRRAREQEGVPVLWLVRKILNICIPF